MSINPGLGRDSPRRFLPADAQSDGRSGTIGAGSGERGRFPGPCFFREPDYNLVASLIRPSPVSQQTVCAFQPSK